MKKRGLIFGALILVSLLMGIGTVHAGITQTAVVVTAAADYSSGAHSVIPIDFVDGTFATHELLPTGSDLTVAAYGQYFYRIGRYQMDHIIKFDISAPDTPIWQFSTLEGSDDTSGNPHDMVFVSDEKAYLFMFGKTKAWIVNPSATDAANFKIGELDLSSYGDQDGIPEMESAVIVNGKMYVIMKRLDRDNSWEPNTPYVAVIDVATDTEIETGIANDDGVKGIPLPVKNPNGIHYLAENNTLYIQGVGRYPSSWSGTPAEYSGGIVTLNPDTYATQLLLDDDTNGDGTPLYGGNISGLALVSATKAYVTIYVDSGDNSLRSFNPSTGTVGGVVAGLENKGISGMASGAYVDKNDMLWVCNQTDARMDIINTADDTIDESISTGLNPLKVVFCGEDTPGYTVDNVWLRAVIKTEDDGEIDAVWKKGDEGITAAGDHVIWGYFYADPADVSWGSAQNPDVFVKIWKDHSGRVDVNFFHVSVPDIEVSSDYPYDGTIDEQDTITTYNRYIRQHYMNGESGMDKQGEDGLALEGDTPLGNPPANAMPYGVNIGAVINTEEKGGINAVWQLGGQDTTPRGDRVVWGHFYASPDDVTWGIAENPDLFVKIWFDVSGRVDVNFFHVSVPDIEIFSDFQGQDGYEQKGTTLLDNRYIRHEYESSKYAVINTRGDDEDNISVINFRTGETFNDLLPVGGACDLVQHGDYVYIVDKGNDRIIKFDPYERTAISEVSIGAGTAPNTIAFASDTKAYVPSSDAALVTIMNPQTMELIGAIDISEMADDDGDPDQYNAVIKDDLLFVTLRRSSGRSLSDHSSLAVIDITTDTVVSELVLQTNGVSGMSQQSLGGQIQGENTVTGNVYVNISGSVKLIDDGAIEAVDADRLTSAVIFSETDFGGNIVYWLFDTNTTGWAICGLSASYEGGTGYGLMRFDLGDGTFAKVSSFQDSEYTYALDFSDDGIVLVGSKDENNPGVLVFDAENDYTPVFETPIDVGLLPNRILVVR